MITENLFRKSRSAPYSPVFLTYEELYLRSNIDTTEFRIKDNVVVVGLEISGLFLHSSQQG